MRILHISLTSGASPNFPIRTELKKIATFYFEIDWVNYRNLHGLEQLQNHIIETSKKGFDLIFMQLQTPEIVTPEIGKILSKNSFVVNWTGDVRENINWYIALSENIDLTLFTNRTDVLRCPKSDYLQISCDDKNYTSSGDKGAYAEIVFIGNDYDINFPLSKFRRDIVKSLKKEFGHKFQVYGHGWETRHVNEFEESAIYRSCKIAINISHFNYLNYSSDRLFRIMFSGAFCLSHDYKGISDEFLDKKHLGTFINIKDLISKCHYWLKNEKQRKKIAIAGQKEVKKNHTWSNRIKTLMKMVDFLKAKKELLKYRLNKIPELMPNQDKPFNGDSFVVAEFLKLRNKFDIQTAVETGTCVGGTTKFLAENFKTVHTIEINKSFQNIAKIHVDSDNVDFILGDSAKEINKVCEVVKNKKVIFFLDSHWNEKLPLLDELTAIAKNKLTPIIVIHDFFVPNEKLGFDVWENKKLDLSLIKSYLNDIYKGKYTYYYNTFPKSEKPNRGLIYIIPND